ncbi:MAG TPA: dihydrodipicolinate synthase family protein [Acidimicrobiales bacterium]|nr:dihydrodipicolinate synthase family protein [Acidimicrobiales bacterium]
MVKASERKEWARERCAGLFFGNTTPFTPDLSALDEEGLRHNLRRCVELSADGLGAGGPLGEPYTLTVDERKRVHEILAEEARAAGVVSYAYPVHETLPELLDLVSHCAQVGCDLAMVNVPFEWAKSDGTIYRFFELVCEAAGDMGVMLYNTPHAGYILPPELEDRIVDLPNVCCMKGHDQSVDHVVKVNEAIGDRIVVSAGSVTDWPAYAEAGIVMMSPTSGNYMLQTPGWTPVREMYDLSVQGRLDEARRIYERDLAPLVSSWLRIYAPLFDRPFGREEHPCAGIKAWQDEIGMVGGPARPLTLEFSDEDRTWLRAEIASHVGQGRLPGVLTT